MEEQALKCSGCGHPRDETFDPETAWKYRGRVLKCFACAARDRAHKKHTSNKHHDDEGIVFAVSDDGQQSSSESPADLGIPDRPE